MLNWYQYIPEHINPIAFSIRNFPVRWYAIMYLVGFFVVYLLLKNRIKKREYEKVQSSPSSKAELATGQAKFKVQSLLIDFLIYSFIGLIIGARLGYVLFYIFSYFIKNPLSIILPFNSSGNFTGIYGMSYFGGLVGIISAGLVFCEKRNISFWQWADFIVPAIPAGYFFGRIGNFLNGELYGRATDSWIGMYFNGQLRHPSQLYEAFFEGIILFIILWAIRNLPPTILEKVKIDRKKSITLYIFTVVRVFFKMVGGKAKFPGQLLLIYLLGYGFFRFFIEFFREPDPQIGLIFGVLTLGQIFCLILMIITACIYRIQAKKA